MVGRSRDWAAQGELLEVRSGTVRGVWWRAGLLGQAELCRDKKSNSGACAGTSVVCAALP